MPLGTAGDTAGNSVACRTYHVGAAVIATSDPETHCAHGNAIGGAGAVGFPCTTGGNTFGEAFCALSLSLCTGANADPAFTDAAGCATAAGGLTSAGGIPWGAATPGTSITNASSIECRIYHLEAAASNVAGGTQATHCPHGQVASIAAVGSADPGPCN
jgi:hypothetical protein